MGAFLHDIPYPPIIISIRPLKFTQQCPVLGDGLPPIIYNFVMVKGGAGL